MLTMLRKQTGSILIKSLLILLIISFGAWGIQDWLSPALSGNAIATVGKQEITPYELQRRVGQQMNRFRQVFGNQFTLEQARRFGIVEASLNELVSRSLITEGAQNLGVSISDDLVSSEIRGQESFKGLSGSFDRDRFYRMLQANGMNEGIYVAEIRRDIGIQHFADSLTAGADAPRVLVDAIYSYRNEKRTADVLLIEDAIIEGIAEPTQSDLDAYHKENAKIFTAPEYRKLTYLSLEAETLAKEIDVSEDAIKESYESRAEEFNTPEKRRVMQMILSDEALAKKAHEKLVAGGDFAEVAKEVANLAPETLDLGTITESDLLPELAKPAFAAALGTVTAPYKSAFGWHIFKVTELYPGGIKDLADVRDILKQALAKEKAIDSLFDLSNRLEDQLGGGATLEEASQELGLNIAKIDTIDDKGMDASGQPVTSFPGGGVFIQAAFSVGEGEESPLTESGPEGFFIIRVDAITAPILKPLDTVRTQVIDAWKNSQRAEKGKELAEKITKRLNEGGELKTVADEAGLASKTTKPFTRSDTGAVSDLSKSLVEKVFTLGSRKAAMGRSAEGYQIARLKEVFKASPGADADGTAKLKNELREAIRGDVVAQLGNALKDEHGVEINQAMVQQMYTGVDRSTR